MRVTGVECSSLKDGRQAGRVKTLDLASRAQFERDAVPRKDAVNALAEFSPSGFDVKAQVLMTEETVIAVLIRLGDVQMTKLKEVQHGQRVWHSVLFYRPYQSVPEECCFQEGRVMTNDPISVWTLRWESVAKRAILKTGGNESPDPAPRIASNLLLSTR